MSNQHPDRDSLSAYIEETLSIDASQWIKQPLKGCEECRAKLSQEQAFLRGLDGLSTIEPPADFTEGVMARVAQYPAYQPGVPSVTEVPWRRAAMWAGAAAAATVVFAIFLGWVLVAGSAPGGEQAESPATGAARVAAASAEGAKNLYFFARDQGELLMPFVQVVLSVALGIVDFIRNAGLMVNLALLLVTVGLNYALTRMVLNYQRRQ